MGKRKPYSWEYPDPLHPSMQGAALILPINDQGGIVHDQSGKNNHGTNNGATWVKGDNGSALSFDGTDSVDLNTTEFPGTSLFADSTQRFTVISRFKVESGNTGALLAKAGATSANRTFQMGVLANKLITQTRGTLTLSTLTVDDGVWHTAVATWDGSVLRRYIDGEFDSNGGVGVAAEETNEEIFLGARTGGTAFRLTGIISYTDVYNLALSAQQVKQQHEDPWDAWERESAMAMMLASQGEPEPEPTIEITGRDRYEIPYRNRYVA